MKFFILSAFLMTMATNFIAQNSLSATYTNDIPTSFDTYDNSCTGPSTVLIITLPPGDNYTVTSVDVVYNMTAQGSGWKSHQRSAIVFENSNTQESPQAMGSGDTPGVQMYSRSISIANGSYTGGTELIFQMRARRTLESTTGCNTSVNRVDANTWTVTVHYTNEVVNPKVGINTSNPASTLDVNGTLKLGNSNSAPQAGTVRWNAASSDFEGYNGVEWVSFTKNESDIWGDKSINDKFSATATDYLSEDKFGGSVSISGDYAIVGASYKNVNSISAQGKAYIFIRSGTSWSEQTGLISHDLSLNDFFGHSVSISGDYAIVGAFRKKVGGNDDQGKAYIFKRSGTNWIEQVDLVASDGEGGDLFGNSVSISGDYAIVGANNKNEDSNNSQGKVYFYKRSGTIWIEQVSFVATDGAEDDLFGSSVSISGDYAVVGAYSKDVGSNLNQGKAYIYKRLGTSWVEQSILVASDGAASDYFGFSVSITGDYAIVGAVNKDGVENASQGKAYIFKRSGTFWTEQVGFVASDGKSGDYFGRSVSISGDYAIVGADGKNVGIKTDQGKAYIYKRSGTNWTEQVGLFASDCAPYDKFGFSVSISGTHVIVGGPEKDLGSNTNAGKIYFFNKD